MSDPDHEMQVLHDEGTSRNNLTDMPNKSYNDECNGGEARDEPEEETMPLSEVVTVPLETDYTNGSYDPKASQYFNDGVRKIDFILVYEKTPSPTKHIQRDTFEKNLEAEGLQLEKAFRKDGKLVFVKIHAPWAVLTRVAEVMALKMPIKEYDIDEPHDFWCLAQCANPIALDRELVEDPVEYFTADFKCEREDMFIINDKETFFSTAQRSLIVHELLLRTRYHLSHASKFGVDKLVKLNCYTAAFPLHDGVYSSEHSILSHGALNPRHLLYEMWASPSKWYKLQPLDLIRNYFGEKIAIYFAWLGYYTYMLFPAAVIGIVVFLYGLVNVFLDVPSGEICDKTIAGNILMCPLCDKHCPYWKLETNCIYSRLTHVFDNYGTVVFSGFMAIWSTAFLEFWKRRQAVIQYDWDIGHYDKEERLRPDFEVRVKRRRINQITKVEEPYLPWWSRVPRLFTSLTVVLFLVCCVVCALFGVIMYRVIMLSVLYVSSDKLMQAHAKIITSVTAAVLNLIAIMFLNRLYENVAMWLTDLEYPRTESDYEDSFIFKMFMFRFLNHYASIFYIAFFKGRTGGRPGDYDYKLGYRAEECDPAGCLIELGIQLGIIMVGKQALNNFQELMLPKIFNWIRLKRSGQAEENRSTRPQWEQDNDLQDFPTLGLVPEYMEMVIQYGFITIFVAAFPLAPLFALLNNIIEIRLDAYKMVTQVTRPIPAKAHDIGIWFGILKGLTFVGIISNAFIIGWTSDFVPRIVYQYTVSENTTLSGYVSHSLSFFNVSDFQQSSKPNITTFEDQKVEICRYSDYRENPWNENKYTFTAMYWHVFCARLAFVIVFEHCVLFLTWLVGYLIPDVPAHIQLLILREVHLTKEASYELSLAKARKEHDKMT